MDDDVSLGQEITEEQNFNQTGNLLENASGGNDEKFGDIVGIGFFCI